MSIAALSYVSAVLTDGGLKSFLKAGKIDHLFRSEFDKALFKSWTSTPARMASCLMCRPC